MKKKILWISITVIFLILMFPLTAYGDLGPKPSLTIIVNNPPDELYYLDLLINDTDRMLVHGGSVGRTPSDFETQQDETDMEKLLRSYAAEGWIPVMLEQKYQKGGPSVSGKLTGRQHGEAMHHEFGYIVPRIFRIIIVTESGDVTVSDVCETEHFDSTVTLDYATKSSEITGSDARARELESLIREEFIGRNTVDATVEPVKYPFRQLPFTLAFTLLAEGIILLLFKFKLRENLGVFLITNTTTQAFLYLALWAVWRDTKAVSIMLVMVPFELLIIGIEAAVYTHLLKGGGELRRLAYAVCANLVSWLGGGIIFIFTA